MCPFASENATSKEIGIALTHYHQKLGPLIVSHQGPLAKNFDRISQYNILQDSISTCSSDLALFVQDKFENEYTVRIKKIKIYDSMARGGVKRYAVLLLIPHEMDHFARMISDIAEDIGEKVEAAIDIQECIEDWYRILNEQYGMDLSKKEIAISSGIDSILNS